MLGRWVKVSLSIYYIYKKNPMLFLESWWRSNWGRRQVLLLLLMIKLYLAEIQFLCLKLRMGPAFCFSSIISFTCNCELCPCWYTSNKTPSSKQPKLLQIVIHYSFCFVLFCLECSVTAQS